MTTHIRPPDHGRRRRGCFAGGDRPRRARAIRGREHVRPHPPHQGLADRRPARGIAVFLEGHHHGRMERFLHRNGQGHRQGVRCQIGICRVRHTETRCSICSRTRSTSPSRLNPTPARALSIGFTHPMIIHPFGCVARDGLAPKTWSDINKPEIRIVYDIGSLHETAAKRYCSKAQLTGFKNRDECLLNLQSGRADVHILAAILGLSEVGKNPNCRRLLSADRAAGRLAELPRHSARAGHAVQGGHQRLARHGPGQRTDPRMDAGRARQGRRVSRAGAGGIDVLNGRRVPCITNGTSRFCCAMRRCSGKACWSRWATRRGRYFLACCWAW